MNGTNGVLSICTASTAILASFTFNIYSLINPPKIERVVLVRPNYTVPLRPMCWDSFISDDPRFLSGRMTKFFRGQMTASGFPTLVGTDGRLYVTREIEQHFVGDGFGMYLNLVRQIAERAYRTAKGRRPNWETDQTSGCLFIRTWTIAERKKSRPTYGVGKP